MFMGSYPINLYEWRNAGPLCAETVDFHRKAQNDFSADTVRDIVMAGNTLAQLTGGLDGALFQFQEHEFRLLQPQLDYISDNQKWIPQLSEEMMETMRIGVTASYTLPPPCAPRRRGFPYRGGDALEIIQKLWPEISKGGMFICGTAIVGGGEAWIEAAPSTLVLKRNPDRSRSTENASLLTYVGLTYTSTHLMCIRLSCLR